MPSDDRDHASRRPLPFPTDRTSRTTGGAHPMHHRDIRPTPIGAHRAAITHPAFSGRRAVEPPAATTTAKERITMSSIYHGPNLHYAHAEARRRDMLSEAQHARLLAEIAVRPRRVIGVAAMRRHIGSALVRAGHRLQGVGSAEPANVQTAAGALRGVR